MNRILPRHDFYVMTFYLKAKYRSNIETKTNSFCALQIINNSEIMPSGKQSVLSYDLYGPKRYFPLENHEEKVRYEARTRRSDKAGKTRTALLEMHTAPQNRC